jgi:hypothetical protein
MATAASRASEHAEVAVQWLRTKSKRDTTDRDEAIQRALAHATLAVAWAGVDLAEALRGVPR